MDGKAARPSRTGLFASVLALTLAGACGGAPATPAPVTQPPTATAADQTPPGTTPAPAASTPTSPGTTPTAPPTTPMPSGTTPALTRSGPPITPPSPTPADLSARPLTWFAPLPPMPGRTGAADFMDQFQPDAPWQAAAQHIDVYKLYGEWVAYDATDAQLRQAVQDIARRGMVLAIEAGPLDPQPDCGQDVESFAGADEGRLIARRIIAAGGRIAVIALDEPYYFGHVYDGANACHLPLDQIARNVVGYVTLMRGFFPELLVGDTEPTPEPVSAKGLADWLDAYRAASGEAFAFLHLDTDWARPGWPDLDHQVQARAAARGVPLGMIYNGGSAPSRRQWIEIAGQRVKTFESSGDRADHNVFQSWMVQPDRVLPDDDPTTFSGLVRTYFEDYAGLGAPTSGPGANLALGRPVHASSALPDSPPSAAVDGDFDTLWSSGADPRQWIEVTLDGPSDVAEVRLTVSQYPAGPTDHRLLGRRSDGTLVELHRFNGTTSDGMVLDYAPPEPWHDLVAIRVDTRASPSWVAWREIEVIAP